MKQFKKLFAVVASVAMAATMLPTTFAATYSTEVEGAYSYAYANSITTVSTIDAANPYGKATRAQVAKMIANWAEKEADDSIACSFSDSAAAEGDLAEYMVKACKMGLMGQGITAFRPNDTVTRGEFATVLSRALWGEENNGGTPFYTKHMEALKTA